MDKNSGKITMREVNVENYIGWKDKLFMFDEEDMVTIMNKLARWYDVDVVYEDESVKNYLFGCNFNRHVTVTPLLELFQSTGTVRFEVVGKKIIVKK